MNLVNGYMALSFCRPEYFVGQKFRNLWKFSSLSVGIVLADKVGKVSPLNTIPFLVTCVMYTPVKSSKNNREKA